MSAAVEHPEKGYTGDFNRVSSAFEKSQHYFPKAGQSAAIITQLPDILLKDFRSYPGKPVRSKPGYNLIAVPCSQLFLISTRVFPDTREEISGPAIQNPVTHADRCSPWLYVRYTSCSWYTDPLKNNTRMCISTCLYDS